MPLPFGGEDFATCSMTGAQAGEWRTVQGPIVRQVTGHYTRFLNGESSAMACDFHTAAGRDDRELGGILDDPLVA